MHVCLVTLTVLRKLFDAGNKLCHSLDDFYLIVSKSSMLKWCFHVFISIMSARGDLIFTTRSILLNCIYYVICMPLSTYYSMVETAYAVNTYDTVKRFGLAFVFSRKIILCGNTNNLSIQR